MKIAWYTPHSEYSAIGTFSREVIAHLLQLGHEVVTIRSEKPGTSVARSEAPPIGPMIAAQTFDHCVKDFLREFDVVIYNVGNHYFNHYYAIRHQALVPGVTILHDFMLHHLLFEYCADSSDRTYESILEAEAGKKAVEAYRSLSPCSDPNEWFLSQAIHFPVMRFAAHNTLGVVAHANFYESNAQHAFQCPTAVIPLAYPQQPLQGISLPQVRNAKLRLLTIGDVNKNKRCESVIQALQNDPVLASNWEYRIAGNITSTVKESLTSMSRSGKHPCTLRCLGTIDDAKLSKEIEESHAISCLRYPVIEGASASAIVALASGRPVLTSDGGCYDEIPDELVYRIPIATEQVSIQKSLTAIHENYEHARQKAIRARDWSATRHGGSAYANALLTFLQSVIRQQPVMELADRVGKRLSEWHCPPSSPVVEKVDRALSRLFCSSNKRGI